MPRASPNQVAHLLTGKTLVGKPQELHTLRDPTPSQGWKIYLRGKLGWVGDEDTDQRKAGGLGPTTKAADRGDSKKVPRALPI